MMLEYWIVYAKSFRVALEFLKGFAIKSW